MTAESCSGDDMPAVGDGAAAAVASIRDACEGLVPPEGLRRGVLDSLSDLRDVGRPSRAGSLGLGIGGVAAAAAIALVAWPREAQTTERRVPATVTPFSPTDVASAVAKERGADRQEYERSIGRLRAEAKGKWVMIACEPPPDAGSFKPVVIGETAQEMAKFAPHAKHRYVFRVGDEGDLETFASAWYGPRFAGSGFGQALHLRTTSGGSEITLAGAAGTAIFQAATPFPRVGVAIATVDGRPLATGDPAKAGAGMPEVWLGTVGPTLMLTPEDDQRLSLSRWEVPGTETVFGAACRRVLVSVSVPSVTGSAVVVAAVPDLPYERLVAMARGRNQFWQWADVLQRMLDLPAKDDKERGNWIVVGNDRVLGEGATASDAIVDADRRMRDVVYQRYVLRWPREGPLEVDVHAAGHVQGTMAFVEEGGGPFRDAIVSTTDDADVLLWRGDDDAWAHLFARFEEGRDVVLVDGDKRLPTRAAYARNVRGPRNDALAKFGIASGTERCLVVRDPRPAPTSAPTPSTSTRERIAALVLRNLIASQAQLQMSAKVDVDQDGVGEYGGFVELSGAAPGRMSSVLSPAVVSDAFRSLDAQGEAERFGFLFRIHLPGVGGKGVGEPAAGFSKASGVDPDLAEEHWCCYAWPQDGDEDGALAFFVDQEGDVLATSAASYRGRGHGPLPGAAYADGGIDAITGKVAADARGQDGKRWEVVH